MKRPIPTLKWLASGLAAALVVSLGPAPAHADVQSTTPAGFVLRIETAVAAAPTAVYDRIFQIGQWWSDGHTYSGKAANMTLEKEPGGCFCETLPKGGFVRHGSLEYADPGKVVRLSGALGPLQTMTTNGVLSFDMAAAAAGGTRLVVTYTVSGYQPDKGFAVLAPPVDSVLKEQIERLKRLAETGKAAP